jgi:guanylate kinase
MKNELVHLAEFEELLKNYKMSDELSKELRRGDFIILSSATSTGRNTIIDELQKTGNYCFILSDTTRHPRYNNGVLEQDGGPYWFKSEEEVLEGLKRGNYLGPAIIHNQQVSGMSLDELVSARKSNKIPIIELEIQGFQELTEYKPDIIAFFVLPPSFNEWMRRLKNRGGITPEEFKRRLVSSIKEFEYALESDKYIFVINDSLDRAVKEISSDIRNLKADMKTQKTCRELANTLKEAAKNLLSTLD